jgi:integrase/recombinase XerD
MMALPISAVRRGQDRITITGKGGRERVVLLTAAAHAAIDAWIEVRAAEPDALTSPYLFPRGDGVIPRQEVNADLARLARDAGIGRSVSPHMLRHSFATHMLNRGADLRSLQMLLGHADIATTEIYTKTRDDRLAGLVRDIHPLAQKD